MAADGGELADRENEARAACLMGNYQKGAEILVRLFIQTRNPVYLYNQGRCYQQNHRWDEAIDRFREYLRKVPDGKDPDKDALKQIAECEANLSKSKGAHRGESGASKAEIGAAPVKPAESTAPTPSPSADAAPAAASATPAPPAMQVDLTQVAPPPSVAQTSPSIFSRWWFWTSVGVVVAGGVTAVLLLSRGSSNEPFCPDCANTVDVSLP